MINKSAQFGGSVLVLVSALLLVVSFVFFAMWTVFSETQESARAVGALVADDIGSAMTVVAIYAEDGVDGSVDYFYESVKTHPSSQVIPLNQTLLFVAMRNTSKEFIFDDTIDCTIKNASNVNSIYNDSNADYFGLEYPKGGATYTGFIMAGELVRICWKNEIPVARSDNIVIRFYSYQGYSAVMDTQFDEVVREPIIYFFP